MPAHAAQLRKKRYKRFPARVKERILKRVLEDGEVAAKVCKEVGISRKTFYAWKRIWDGAYGRGKKSALSLKYAKGDSHPRNYRSQLSSGILGFVVSHPEWGSRSLTKALSALAGKKIGQHAVYSLLSDMGLKTRGEREEFSRLYQTVRGVREVYEKRTLRLLPFNRKRLVEAVLLEGKSITEACREFKVSRKSFYLWKRRYEEAQADEVSLLDWLEDRYVSETDHPRATAQRLVDEVLDTVVHYPQLSVHRLDKKIASVGHHAIQNILQRYGLNTFEKRVAWAQLRQGYAGQAQEVRPETGWLGRLKLAVQEFLPSRAPAPPPLGLLRGKPLFRGKTAGQALRHLQRFSPYLLLTLLITFSLYQWGYLLGQATNTQQAIGWVFASIALSMGSFFFLYSLKYYFTLAIVLSFSREVGSTDSTLEETSRSASEVSRSAGWLGRIFGINVSELAKVAKVSEIPKVESSGLDPNISETKLERYPFISVHLPMFNEKRVAERLLKACTSFDYSSKGGQVQYEIVVADDSTDETTQIIRDYLNKFKVQSSKLKVTKEEGKIVRQAEVASGIRIKHIQRATRSGFKGGALALALAHSDPRAEFIVVFDADFVPYPDTLELFVKYFQASAGTLGRNQSQAANPATTTRMPAASMQVRDDNSDVNSLSELSNNRLQKGDYRLSKIAAVQGYQWHVLNKSENWITRGVRTEHSGSYVVERSGLELYGGLKQIAGSVYMVRRDLLNNLGWGTSITEDFQLTLKLYSMGYKVIYTPFIQAPSECVSTLKRLVRQRMRWAEGHSHNIRRMFTRLMFGRWEEISNYPNYSNQTSNTKQQAANNNQIPNSRFKLDQLDIRSIRSINNSRQRRVWLPSPLKASEKLEFLYLSPYYLQAAFFLIGTVSWLFSELVIQAPLPFWTSVWGWSLLFTNMLSLPLMNSVGLFLEEAEERDFMGILSFQALSYILVPFQAYAAVKGLIEREEGPWFRTPKTGLVTDIFKRGRLYRFIKGIITGRAAVVAEVKIVNPAFAYNTANNQFNSFWIKPRRRRWVSKIVLVVLLTCSVTIYSLTKGVPEVLATSPNTTQYLRTDTTATLTNTRVLGDSLDTGSTVTASIVAPKGTSIGRYEYRPGSSGLWSEPTCQDGNATSYGWILDTPFEDGGSIGSGAWQFTFDESDSPNSQSTGTLEVCAYKITVNGGSITGSTSLFDTGTDGVTWPSTDIINNAGDNTTFTTASYGPFSFSANEYLFIQYSLDLATTPKDTTSVFTGGDVTGSDPVVILPSITIPENVVLLLAVVPFIPMLSLWVKKKQMFVINRIIE